MKQMSIVLPKKERIVIAADWPAVLTASPLTNIL
jgi:hypothetical protein